MGYYDKGSYGKGSYDPDEERQSARDRYIELLTKQRMNDQAMTDKMRHEAEQAQQKADYQQSGDMAASGAQKGYAMSGGNPYGALIGGLIGKGAGAVDYGKKHGGWTAGVRNFLNPVPEVKALTGQGGAGSSGAAAGIVQTTNEKRAADKRERLLRDLEMQKQQQAGGGGFERSGAPTTDYYGSTQNDQGESQSQMGAGDLGEYNRKLRDDDEAMG